MAAVARLFPRPEREATPEPRSGPVLIPLSRDEANESEFLRGISRGDPAAVAQLFDRFAPLVRGMLIRVLGRTHEIDDLVQDVFIVLVRRCGALERPEALRSFVVGVTIRTAKKALRLRSLRRWVGLEELDAPPVYPEHDAIRAEQVRRAYGLLDRMSGPSRLVFVLRHVEELELTEVAKATGCSLATTKRRLARAERHFEALARGDQVLRDLMGGSD